ncbi:MAG: hypothetical protein QE278_12445 [Limnobacter sp.]|nr:hypothetical protein [Limnobacter sp.]
MTSTWIETQPKPTVQSVLDGILDYLGITEDQLGPSVGQEGFRIEFEDNYCVELATLTQEHCRFSARICLLARSLEVQERQIHKALDLYAELHNGFPIAMSLSISHFDNCLRMTTEVAPGEYLIENKPGKLEDYFENFVNYSHAFKKTYLNP